MPRSSNYSSRLKFCAHFPSHVCPAKRIRFNSITLIIAYLRRLHMMKLLIMYRLYSFLLDLLNQIQIWWWWRQYAPLKRRSTIILHGSISQKTTLNFKYSSQQPQSTSIYSCVSHTTFSYLNLFFISGSRVTLTLPLILMRPFSVYAKIPPLMICKVALIMLMARLTETHPLNCLL
jgi:hypothetical protein